MTCIWNGGSGVELAPELSRVTNGGKASEVLSTTASTDGRSIFSFLLGLKFSLVSWIGALLCQLAGHFLL